MNNGIKAFLVNELNEETELSPKHGLFRHMNHYHWASKVIDENVEGDFVECGSYKGGTAKLLSLVIRWKSCDKKIHLYDSFKGLPPLGDEDEPFFCPGEFKQEGAFCVSRKTLEDTMKGFNYEIHEGWFSETLPDQLPNKICYAHLDSDLYAPIKESLEAVYPRLTSGAICVIDDYDFINFPGVKLAVDEFMLDKTEEVISMFDKNIPSSFHAYFRKN